MDSWVGEKSSQWGDRLREVAGHVCVEKFSRTPSYQANSGMSNSVWCCALRKLFGIAGRFFGHLDGVKEYVTPSGRSIFSVYKHSLETGDGIQPQKTSQFLFFLFF